MGRGPGGRGGARGGGQGRGGFQGGRGRGRGRGGRGGLGPQGGVGKKHGGDRKDGNKHRSIKNQIRGVERLLKREGLDPRARAAKEAELAELKASQEAHARAERERKYAVMYHKVKFFERVKLERAIKRHERALAGAGAGGVDSSDDAEEDRGASSTAEAGAGGHADKAVPAEPAEIREMLAKLKEDLQYVLNFPKGEKYVSILKNVEDPEAQKHLETERERLRGVIRMQLAEVAAVTEADEGRALLGDKALAAAVSAAVSSKAAPAKRKGDKPGMPAVRVVQPRKAVARGGNGRKRRDEGEDSPETSEAASDDFFLADGSEEGGPDRPESDQEGKEDDGGDSDGESEEDIAAPKPLPPAAKARPSSKAPVGAAAAGPASAMTIKTQAVAPGAGSKRGQAFLVAGGGAEDGAEEDDFFLAAGSDDDQPAAGSSYKLQTAPPDPATRAAVGAPADWTKGRDGAKGQARPERGVGEGRGHERGPGQEGEMGRGRGAARGGMGRGGRGRGFRQPTPPPTEGKPLRTRAEGGRKRRK